MRIELRILDTSIVAFIIGRENGPEGQQSLSLSGDYEIAPDPDSNEEEWEYEEDRKRFGFRT